MAEEAANLIGEFDEGLSNRQTWNNAALAAIAVWFEDEELAGRAVESPSGAIAHLVRGFGEDGMWYEGENYHLFALRGQLLALGWASQAGVDVLSDPRLAGRLASALWAPAVTALPDHTFPARKDSRYGVSLAQPMYLELWEIGLARLGDESSPLWGWLADLYRCTPPPPQRFDSYLHEAGQAAGSSRGRSSLSWWSLLEMVPSLPPASETPWQPDSTLLDSQGLAILRRGQRYASLECGVYGGGHGHPDRLHLTLHADGAHWLADPGTGSYVARDLFWYRSTLAHNAPRLDGMSQPEGDARCLAFGKAGDWAWTRGGFGGLTRTVVAGPEYLLDIVEFGGEEAHLLELPWHPTGQTAVESPGAWSADTLTDEFVADVMRFGGSAEDPIVLRARTGQGTELSLHLLFEGELLRATGPGLPGAGRATFYLVRRQGRAARFLTVAASGVHSREVRGVAVTGDEIEVRLAGGIDRHVSVGDGWDVTRSGETIRLRGVRRVSEAPRPLVDRNRVEPVRAIAVFGGADLVEQAEPLVLDYEDQYRRSEEPYPGPEEFSASAAAAWSGGRLHLLIDVRTGSPHFRSGDEPRRASTTNRTTSTATVRRLPSSRRRRTGRRLPAVPDIGSAGIGLSALVTRWDEWMVEGHGSGRRRATCSLTIAIPSWQPHQGD